jgi:DNA-nicking Smr family endonuclease
VRQVGKPFHRPFRRLRKLAKRAKPAPPQPTVPPLVEARIEAPVEPRGFDDLAPVARTPQRARVPRELPPPAPRVPPRAADLEHAFSLRVDFGTVECLRDDEDDATLGWLARRQPSAELDLHGKDARAARAALRAFVRARVRGGHQVVLVITGRGKRSPRGPVLRLEAPGWLIELGALVRAFTTAPGALGGEGAILVLLAQPGDKRR